MTRTYVALYLAVMLPAASASSPIELSTLVRLTSNYEYRGYTLSDDHAAAQANVDVAWSNGVYLGSWVSSVDFGDASLVANPYLGTSFTVSPDWQCVTSVSGHFFDRKVNDYNASYAEGALRLDYRDLVSVQVNISPDYYGTAATVMTYESELRYPLSETIEVSGGLGYQASRDALDHNGLYSNVGIAWYILPNLTLDLRYHNLHVMNERPYQPYSDPPPAYELDTPVIFSISIGL